MKIEIENPPTPPKYHKWEVRGHGWKKKEKCNYAYYVSGRWDKMYSTPTGHHNTYYLEAVRTHYDDGVPIELSPFPTMPDHVEKLEYHGTHMKPEDMGDADNYITCYAGGTDWRLAGIKYKYTDRSPVGSGHHYARVFFKKEKPAPTEELPEFEGWKHDLSKGKWGMSKEEMLAIGCDGVTLWSAGSYGKFKPKLGWHYDVKSQFYLPAYKVKVKPAKTELSDLIGEDGQKIAYLINDIGGVAPFELCKQGEKWDDYAIKRNTLMEDWRWSHSPFTAYEHAHPFVF